jgi:predicted anti-sigma-YlaC factor YlaD
MRASILPMVCERVRGQVSVQLDGELSQLEQRMVAAHLERCDDCAAFEASVRSFTEELRAAPREAPRRPIVVRRTRRVSFSALQVSAAATVAVAVLGVVSLLGSTQQNVPSVDRQVVRAENLFKTSWQPELELAQIDPVGLVRQTDGPGPIPGF